MFRVGQKVVAVNDADQGNRQRPIKAGEIYTIHRIVEHKDFAGNCGLCAFLSEIEPEKCPLLDEWAPFALSRFRPIVPRPTSIEFAHEILRKATRTDEVSV
jgi:hypothetical protein